MERISARHIGTLSGRADRTLCGGRHVDASSCRALEDHDRHLNARNTLIALLERGVIPVINENDAVSFTELTVGDNDKLSALVAALLPADLPLPEGSHEAHGLFQRRKSIAGQVHVFA